MDLKIVLFLFCFLILKATGLRCYACSFSSSDSDQSCLIITDTTHTVDCPFTYCTIMRQEFMDPAGAISSFLRGCEEEPDHLNHEIVDPTFRTFYRACTNDLCNIGNGIQPVVGGSLSPRPVYTGDNLLVPGTSNSASIKASLATALSMMILHIIFILF